MTVFLHRQDVINAGSIACGCVVTVGDEGLLAASIARPQTTVFGLDAYPTIWEKSAALMESLARNHALIDGNKRTAWASTWLFLRFNGIVLADNFNVDEAEKFCNNAAIGTIRLDEITQQLHTFAE